MKKKHALHCCLAAGVCALLLQMALLVMFINHDSTKSVASLQVLRQFLNLANVAQVPVVLVDPKVLELYDDEVRNVDKRGCVFCSAGKAVSFAALSRTAPAEVNLVSLCKAEGFKVIVINNFDPLLLPEGKREDVAVSYFFQKDETLIQVVQLFDREGNFWWHGSIKNDPEGVDQISAIGLTMEDVPFMKYEGALEKFDKQTIQIDGLTIQTPKHLNQFLEDCKSSRFIECSYRRAAAFYRMYGKDTSVDAVRFRHKAWKLLSKTKTVLDDLEIPFWLSSGTCLGYFRQCDIIPYARDVDVGVHIEDYSDKIIPKFTSHGFALKHWFGKVNDSLELTFQLGDVKLDIFFFYTEGDTKWNGGTQAKSGKKFKYIFPRFDLCWTEFLELKVRTPCQTESYIEANYGSEWFTPVVEWDWKSSPSNVKDNGVWKEEELSQVIRLY